MNITADTNLLVRVIMRDDPAQAQTALEILESASAVAIPPPCLCEFAWVLYRVYRLGRDDIALAIRAVTGRANALTDTAAVAAGLRMIEAGGDFADGVIAGAGGTMGGEVFVSFDRKAVARLNAIGVPARYAAPAS